MRLFFWLMAACLTALLLWACTATTGQGGQSGPRYDERPAMLYQDYVYRRNVRTVQFYRAPYDESYPVLYQSQANDQLVLEFDELLPQTERETDFFVDIISCTADWEPSGVLPIEFYEGFTSNRIDEFQRANFTKIPYVHYRYAFPREEEGFKRSGNYLLKVYRNNNPDDVVLTRRFVVADRRIRVQSKYELSARVERQEFRNFSFEVFYKGLDLFDPSTDLRIEVLQNFRWDNALRLTQPRFMNDQSMEYFVDVNQDYQSGQEFRFHGIESVRLLSRSVQDVEEREDLTDAYLFPDEPIRVSEIGSPRDRNGSFSIRVDEFQQNDLQADYVQNFFFLKRSRPFEEGERVYLFGEMTDWNCLPEFRMNWDSTYQRYMGQVLLKQGVYDYQYVVKYPDRPVPDPTPLEGARRLTENFYTILVYFRPPGDRSDLLIGYQPINYYE